MDNKEMKNSIVSIVADSVDEISDDTSFDLREAGMLDSLAMMNIMASLEDEFDIEFKPSDMKKENFLSVDTMCDLVQKYL